jgi:putative nucleotidyltransferase with HDIG domain
MSAAHNISADQMIGRLDELPTLPTIVQELNRIINDPMSSTSDIEDVMMKDPSLTTKVLRLANSAYYAIPGGVKSISRAIAFLGYDTVNQLVLTSSILGALKVESKESFSLDQFWKHSIGVAMCSESIAKRIGYKVPSELFTCGLVHDIGKVVLLILEPDRFASVVQNCNQYNLTYEESENRLELPQHTQLGQLLTKKWSLPQQIQNVILFHHQKDTLKRGGASAEMNQIIDVVMLANLLIHGLKFGNSGYSKIDSAPKILFERLRIEQAELPSLVKEVNSNLQAAESFLKLIQENA